MQFDRPGCFGFAASYNVKSKVCQSCDFNQDCATKAKQSLSDLSLSLNVDAVRALMQVEQVKPAKSVKSEQQQPANTMREKILSRMSAHVARTAGMILDTGINHRVKLLDGVNSMKGKRPASIDLLFDLLLVGPVTRADYVQALQERLEHSPATASSQASIGIAAVVGIGIAKDAGDGAIVIRGNK